MARSVSLRPLPTRPIRPTISPGRTTSDTSCKPVSVVRLLHLEERRRVSVRRRRDRREGDVRRLAEHRLDQARLGLCRDRRRPHHLAVAHHGDAVGGRQRMVEEMGDVDDGAPVAGEPGDHLVQPRRLVGGQRRGRLVHDDDAGVARDGAHDLDLLPIRDPERAHRGASDRGRSRSAGRARGSDRSRCRGGRRRRCPRCRGRYCRRPTAPAPAAAPDGSWRCRAAAPAAASSCRPPRRRSRAGRHRTCSSRR